MKILIIITILIIFISVNSAFSTLSTMVEKYSECNKHMFSGTQECSMTELGKTLNSGMMLLGFLSVVSIGSVYILIKSVVKVGRSSTYAGDWA